jgi:hypothetical protein
MYMDCVPVWKANALVRLHPWAAVVATIAVVAAVAVGGVGAASTREPQPVRGAPLGAGTGIRLIVAHEKPFVLDVDTGTATRLRGFPAIRRGLPYVVGVGGRGAVVIAPSTPESRLYGVTGGSAEVSALGPGKDVVPDGDGRSVWIKRFVDRSHCTLRQTSLDGRLLRAPIPFRCASTIYPGGSLGLIVSRTRVIEPRSGRTLLRTRWGVLAVAGRRFVLAGPDRRLAVLDATANVEHPLSWPSVISRLDRPAADPRGRLVVLAFGTPPGREAAARRSTCGCSTRRHGS